MILETRETRTKRTRKTRRGQRRRAYASGAPELPESGEVDDRDAEVDDDTKRTELHRLREIKIRGLYGHVCRRRSTPQRRPPKLEETRGQREERARSGGETETRARKRATRDGVEGIRVIEGGILIYGRPCGQFRTVDFR